MNAVISVLGKDAKGIIYRVSKILYEHDINILDISQTIMQSLFTMVMVVDISTANADFAVLNEELGAVGEEIGVQIRIQHEDIFNSMHRI